MFAERATQALPYRLTRRKSERARRIDVQPMDDTRPESTLSDTEDLGVTRNDRVEHSVVLIRPKGMNTATGRLVDHEPTLALRDESQIEFRSRLGSLLLGTQGSGDVEVGAALGLEGLIRKSQRSA